MTAINVKRPEIEAALKLFDRELRASKEWKGWDARRSQRYAVDTRGLLYPPKKILSLATGIPVGEFIGGAPTNKHFERLGFPIKELHASPRSASPQIPVFRVGRSYSRIRDITGRFGGSGQSGIAPSRMAPAIFLFTGGAGAKYGYADEFERSGCLLYAGEGQVGDMRFTRGNLAVRNHVQDGRALHVFESHGKGQDYEYRGEFVYTSFLIKKGPDREGALRDVIVFRLMPVQHLLPTEVAAEVEPSAPDSPSPTLSDLRSLALEAVQAPGGVVDAGEAVRKTFVRSAKVRAYVLARAAGICELCNSAAPFKRKSDGSPYLEPHHINRVSDGGLDHPRHVAGICPTCHREIHFGIGGAALNDALRTTVEGLEDAMERDESKEG